MATMFLVYYFKYDIRSLSFLPRVSDHFLIINNPLKKPANLGLKNDYTFLRGGKFLYIFSIGYNPMGETNNLFKYLFNTKLCIFKQFQTIVL
jgi:hypothetical protein